MRPGVSVVIPTHPGREPLLAEAIASVQAQLLRPEMIHVVCDSARRGAGVTRDQGLREVQTDWVAFLDSDDVMYPQHLAVLMGAAESSGADYVFAWYDIIDRSGAVRLGCDPLPHFGRVFDPSNPMQTTVTTLVRTELAQSVGFLDAPEGETIHGQRAGEDFRMTLGCVAAGAKFLHVPERTWGWRHWGGNTSGLASRR